MSSILTFEAKLERVDPKTPWGFRMQGGKEFGCPLTILKVNDGSLAAKCGLQQGDIILKIGNNETTNHKNKEAQDLIDGSGNKLDLLLQRGGPTPQRTYEKFSAPTINSYQSPVGTSQTESQNYNTSARPFGSTPGRPSHDVDSVTHHTSNKTFSPSGSTPGKPSHDGDSVTHHTSNKTFLHLVLPQANQAMMMTLSHTTLVIRRFLHLVLPQADKAMMLILSHTTLVIRRFRHLVLPQANQAMMMTLSHTTLVIRRFRHLVLPQADKAMMLTLSHTTLII